ncbi:MAG TPA: hypothetical protein PKD83_10300 [Ignavibacteria bacterium]|nr:hypothetical protein [Ignavibacteria bacterium]
MKFSLNSIILFVQDTEKLKQFYTTFLKLEVIEETKSEWVLLKSGNCSIGLHKAGVEYQVSEDEEINHESNTKIVFDTDMDIFKIREEFLKNDVKMREIRTFENYDYQLCDGEDPEGNVFQIRQKKK